MTTPSPPRSDARLRRARFGKSRERRRASRAHRPTVTTILLWALAVILVTGGLVGRVLPALPGPVLLFAGFVVGAWAEGFGHIGAPTLTLLGVLAVLAYAADFAAGSLGASRYGASRRAVVGAALG